MASSSTQNFPRPRLGRTTFALVSVAVMSAGLVFSSASDASADDSCVASGAYSGGGDGSSAGAAILISTPGDLARLSSQPGDWGKFFEQTVDINLGGCEFTPIGGTDDGAFTGQYDGAGFTISNLKVVAPVTRSGSARAGLFGDADGATLTKIGLVDASINVVDLTTTQVGALLGRGINVEISQVRASGTVSVSGNDVGGLVGRLEGSSTMENSYSSVAVGGTGTQAGGLIGQLADPAQVTNSYARGPVSGGDNTGGLIGRNGVPFGAGAGTVSASFYDEETSGQSDTGKGEPKSTEAMTTFATFDIAGWDIVDGWETVGDNVWGICSLANSGYPFLLREYETDPCVTPPSVGGGDSGDRDVQKPLADTRLDQAAIHLDVLASVGDPVGGAKVLHEGHGLTANSTYSLVLRSAPVTLVSGTASPGGNFSGTAEFPSGIAPGTHTVTLTASAVDGGSLSLVVTFVVSDTGTFASISSAQGSTSGGLAATGPSTPSLLVGAGTSAALILLGVMFAALSRRKYWVADESP